jgi:hypothetical protein
MSYYRAEYIQLACNIKDNYFQRLEAFAEAAKLIVDNLSSEELLKTYQKVFYADTVLSDDFKKTKLKIEIDNVLNRYQIKVNPKQHPLFFINSVLNKSISRSLQAFIQELMPLSSDKKFTLAESLWVWQYDSNIMPVQYPKSKKSEFSIYSMQQEEIFLDVPLTLEQKTNIQNIILSESEQPMWFKKLPEWSQNELKNRFFKNKILNAEFFEKYKPATLRGVPGVVNTTKHEFSITINGKTIITQTFRQGVPVPYNMPESEQLKHTQMNLKQLLEYHQSNIKNFEERLPGNSSEVGAPITHISLLSGGWEDAKFFISSYDRFFNHTKDNNTKFIDQTKQALRLIDSKKIDSYNIPVNNLRPFEPKKIDENFINHIQNRFEILKDLSHQNLIPEQLLALKKVIESMKHYNQNKKNIDGRNPNLFAAGLMMAAVRLSGGTVISNCKSGKDREAAAILMADAIIAYSCIYDSAPKFDDGWDRQNTKARNNFLKIQEKLYLDGVHQSVAYRTSPGSGGIKDGGVFDKDFINRDNIKLFHKVSKAIAENNKPIGNMFKTLVENKQLFATSLLAVLGIVACIGLALSGIGLPIIALGVIVAGLALILALIYKAIPGPAPSKFDTRTVACS